MNYLIDPMVFYVISVLSNLSLVFGVLFWANVLAGFIVIVFIGLSSIDVYTDEDYFKGIVSKINTIKKKYVVIPIVIITLLAISIPSEETMTKMLVASQLNEQNYTMAKEEIIELIDYISEKIDN